MGLGARIVTTPACLRYVAGMGRWLRDGFGSVLVAAALGVVFYGVTQLRAHDYLACLVLTGTGLLLLRAGVELLRPSLGE